MEIDFSFLKGCPEFKSLWLFLVLQGRGTPALRSFLVRHLCVLHELSVPVIDSMSNVRALHEVLSERLSLHELWCRNMESHYARSMSPKPNWSMFWQIIGSDIETRNCSSYFPISL